MALFCDIMILGVAFAMLIIRAELVPIDELNSLLQPFTTYLVWAIVVFFLIKYIVFEVREIGILRADAAAGNEVKAPQYMLLAVYPLCDIGRLLVSIGILSAMVYRLVDSYSLVSPFVDHILYIGLILLAVAIDYWSYDAETVKFNAIATGVFAVAVGFVSKGMFLQGLTYITG